MVNLRTNQGQIPLMQKIIALIVALSTCLFITNAFGEQSNQSPGSDITDNPPTEHTYILDEIADSDWWPKVWGKKARDSLLLGMWSIHLDGSGEYFGNGSNNDQNHLLGFRYSGLTAGTFINSDDDRAWFLGFARELYSRPFSYDGRFDLGYSFGLLYGYGDVLTNWAGMSVFATATFGITWHKMGIDIGIVPVGVVTANFRLDLDF
jgi:hypothetical protein